MEEKISIIIPVFNGEKFIDKCLKSVLNQSFKNYEIIIVDDGSTDSSLEILKRYEKEYQNIIVISQKNRGISGARNIAMARVTGKYITFVDIDDYVSPDYLAVLYNKMSDNIDLVISNALDVDIEGHVIHKKNMVKKSIYSLDEILKEILLERNTFCTCWGNLYKKEICDRVKFDEGIKVCEDMKFMLEYIKYSNNIIIINDNIYYYVTYEGSTIHTSFNLKRMDEIKYCQELIEKYKNSKMEICAISRLVRCVSDILLFNSPKGEDKKMLKAIARKYFFKVILFPEYSNKRKIKLILSLIK